MKTFNEINLNNDMKLFHGQAFDFLTDRTENELETIDSAFTELYPDGIDLGHLEDIFAYDQDWILRDILGYKKDQNGDLQEPDDLTDINNDPLSYSQLEQIIFNQNEIKISDKTKDFIFNSQTAETCFDTLTFEQWIEKIQEEKPDDPEIAEELEYLASYIFDENLWTFNE